MKILITEEHEKNPVYPFITFTSQWRVMVDSLPSE